MGQPRTACAARPSMRKSKSVESAPAPRRTYLSGFVLACKCGSKRRYGVRVSTRPSQGRNPGSNPGIATKFLRHPSFGFFLSRAPCRARTFCDPCSMWSLDFDIPGLPVEPELFVTGLPIEPRPVGPWKPQECRAGARNLGMTEYVLLVGRI